MLCCCDRNERITSSWAGTTTVSLTTFSTTWVSTTFSTTGVPATILVTSFSTSTTWVTTFSTSFSTMTVLGWQAASAAPAVHNPINLSICLRDIFLCAILVSSFLVNRTLQKPINISQYRASVSPGTQPSQVDVRTTNEVGTVTHQAWSSGCSSIIQSRRAAMAPMACRSICTVVNGGSVKRLNS